MDHAPAPAPLPVVFTEPGTSWFDTTLAAVAIVKAAHALDWALRGDAAHHAAHWVHVTRASLLAAPDLEAVLREDGLCPASAGTVARRIAPLAERARRGCELPHHQWLGIASADGVPERDRPVLPVLARLALDAANTLAPPDPSGPLVIAPRLACVSRSDARDGLWAGILATRLDPPGLLEREVLDLLGLAVRVLVDGHAGFDDWLPRPSDPTVRVRIPAEHRGVPLALCPFVASPRAALDALGDGAVFDAVLERVEGAFNAFHHAQRRILQ